VEPSWQPDPSGRHHYRWWDGAAWSASVADDGVVSIDPLPVPAATIVVSTTPRPGHPGAGTPRVATSAADPSSVYATAPITSRSLVGPIVALVVLVLGVVGAVVYLVVFRDDGSTEQPSSEGVSTHQLDGADDFIVREVTLDDGDAIRFRVEGDADRDLVTYFIAPEDLAVSHASRFFKDYGTNVGLEGPEELISDYTDVDDLLSSADVKDALLGYVVLDDADRCCAGVPDTGTFVATVPGTYRIVVVEANGRDADVRVFVQKFPRQLFTYAEITDSLDNDDFFTDSDFFKGTDPFEVG
jgi:hypothetical protein